MLILIYKCILKTLAINGRNLITIAACFQEFCRVITSVLFNVHVLAFSGRLCKVFLKILGRNFVSMQTCKITYTLREFINILKRRSRRENF